jgi:hypothetical protein
VPLGCFGEIESDPSQAVCGPLHLACSARDPRGRPRTGPGLDPECIELKPGVSTVSGLRRRVINTVQI